MASLNKVLLIGNLTRDPELKYIPNGSAVAQFSIAVNRVYKLQTGEKKEEVCFVRIVVWGKIGENCAEYLKKGSPVFVEGRLQNRSWDDQQGQKKSITEVIAQNVQFLGRSGAAQGSYSGSGPTSAFGSGGYEGSSHSGGKEPLEEISLDSPPMDGPPDGDGNDVVPF